MNEIPPAPLSFQQCLDALSFSVTATALHTGENGRIEFANDAMIRIWGKNRSVIGKPLEEALPELKGQPFLEMFRKVWNEGITISGSDTPADLVIDGKRQTFYFDFEYRALKNEAGETYCILHTANEVTQRYLSQQREQNMAEELSAINEELSTSNEELMAINEELIEAQHTQRLLYEELAESTDRFQSMVRQAPVGICIISAADLKVEEVNDAYLELVGKDRGEFENRTIWESVPEAADAYAPVMRQVINTGLPFFAREHELLLVRRGVPEMVFVDFVYEPVKFNRGDVKAIMVLGIDVTEKVKARHSIEEIEERNRLAIEAAEIGTFDLDLGTNVMITSDRFNKIFGFDRHVPRNMFAERIHPDDMDIRLNAHVQALSTGKLHYEVRVIHTDTSVYWIRVQGRVYYRDNRPYRILGTILDITEIKRLNQQKDDFISIASHELKTPITSLKASLQLLERMKDNPSPVMLPKFIDQSVRSMQKISALVDDLLNVSRTNESGLRFKKTLLTVFDLLENSCSHLRAAGEHRIIVHGDRELQVFADEHAIEQVVVNLVNNAVKYAPDSFDIILSAEDQGGVAKISVEDKGPGIDPDKLPYLFDRYYQGEVHGFQNSGLGLGLYISAEIVKRHGGKIGVNSEPGSGSVFWFTIPK